VQIDPVALELELVDLALTVVLAAGLERQQLASRGSRWSVASKSPTVMCPA
jgi:hypothetical protein